MIKIAENYVVEILTSTPRRWTPYRTVNPPHGITAGGQFYTTHHIEVPDLNEEDSVAPETIEITIGNADNVATDLVSNPANRRAPINIYTIVFDDNWNITDTKLWFVGRTGQPRFEGELVMITCAADIGRRGPAPNTDSISLMTSRLPPADGTRQAWFTGAS
jgi:hypothetical protein